MLYGANFRPILAAILRGSIHAWHGKVFLRTYKYIFDPL